MKSSDDIELEDPEEVEDLIEWQWEQYELPTQIEGLIDDQ